MVRPTSSSSDLLTFIGEYVRGKKTLDIGCMDHGAAAAGGDRWLHGHVVRSAASVLGVDILETDVELLRSRGFNMICADATSSDLGDTFEAIVAGELIEHLGDPEGFLRNMRRHLAARGELLITTPNGFFGLHFAEFLFKSVPHESWNEQHVAWYCYFTLQNLLERAGLTPVRCIYFTRSRKLRGLLSRLGSGCPPVLASTLVVIAKRNDAV